MLRSDLLRGRSLEQVIAPVAEFQCATGILPHSSVQLSQDPSPEISTSLYRILQESLTNIAKHSEATQVSISLKQQDGIIYLHIVDDGQGFDPARNTTGFGLQGMRERTIALGGQLRLSSQSGKGCRIMVSVPLPQQMP